MREPFLVRLALGRSAHELPEWEEDDKPQESEAPTLSRGGEPVLDDQEGYIQHYDVRGHPENRSSRSLARRLRRAQNDILATVGVCAPIDRNGRLIPYSTSNSAREQLDKQQILSVTSENELGFWLGAADISVFALSASCLVGLRQRLETFRFYSGVPLRHIIRIEWKRFGSWKFLFAGVPASFAFILLDAACNVAIEKSIEILSRRCTSYNLSRKQRRWATRMVHLLGTALEIVATLAISPIEVFATLQRLDLAPAWPLLPNPMKLTWSSLSPILIPSTPSNWTLRSILAFLIGIGLSPLSLMLAMSYLSTYIENRVGRYTRLALPKPDCPDEYSKKGNEDDDSPAFSSLETGSLQTEIKKDVQAVLDSITNLKTMIDFCRLNEAFSRLLDIFSGRFEAHQSTLDPQTDDTNLLQPRLVRQAPHDEPTPLQPASAVIETTDQNLSTSATESPSTRTPSPQPSASSDLDEIMQRALDENNMVQVTTRSASTDTLHMNVEVFNGPTPGAPVFTSTFSASPRPTVVETIEVEQIDETHHRVTALTMHASVSMVHHVTNDILNILRLPFETYVLRTIARGFLASATPSPGREAEISFLRASVYPAGISLGPGLRAAGWRGAGDYMAKVLLCMGLESAIGFSVWQLGFGVAWWAGNRWHQWGRL